MSKYQEVVSKDPNNNFAMSEIAHKNLDLGYFYFIYKERVFKTVKIKKDDFIYVSYANNPYNGSKELSDSDVSHLKTIESIKLVSFDDAYEIMFGEANINGYEKNNVIKNLIKVFFTVCGTMNSAQSSSELIKMNIGCDGDMFFQNVLKHLSNEININL